MFEIYYYTLYIILLQVFEINDYPSTTVENIIKNKIETENTNITNEPQTNTTGNIEIKLQ